jgi:hypothetical protein
MNFQAYCPYCEKKVTALTLLSGVKLKAGWPVPVVKHRTLVLRRELSRFEFCCPNQHSRIVDLDPTYYLWLGALIGLGRQNTNQNFGFDVSKD